MPKRDVWVFLRGLAREVRHWGRFPDVFRRQFKNSDLVFLDLPGTGLRYEETSPFSVSGITDALRDELLNKGTSLPRSLLSISLGSMVALDWMSRYPEDFQRGVLINSSTKYTGSPLDRFHWLSALKLMRAFLQKDMRVRERSVLSVISNRPEIQREFLQSWVQYAKESPIRLATVLRQLKAGAEFGLPTQKPQGQLLVLRSAKDRLVNPVCSRRLAEWWDLPMHTHPSAGHDLTLDDPEWAVWKVYEWVVSESERTVPK